MSTIYKKIMFAIALITFIVIIQVIGVTHYITLERLKTYRLLLQKNVIDHYLLSVLSFIGIYIIVAACTLPIAAMLTIAAGFLFGTFWGTVYTNIGATIGATIIFIIVRYLIGTSIQKRYSDPLKTFNDAMMQHRATYLLIARFLLFIPFFMVNILAACTTVSLWNFIWTTIIGIIPASLVYTFAGQQLTNLTSIHDIMSWKIMIAFFLLILITLLPLCIQKMWHMQHNNGSK